MEGVQRRPGGKRGLHRARSNHCDRDTGRRENKSAAVLAEESRAEQKQKDYHVIGREELRRAEYAASVAAAKDQFMVRGDGGPLRFVRSLCRAYLNRLRWWGWSSWQTGLPCLLKTWIMMNDSG